MPGEALGGEVRVLGALTPCHQRPPGSADRPDESHARGRLARASQLWLEELVQHS